MYKPDSVQKMRHKILWSLEIQTGHSVLTRRPDFVIINKQKRTCRQMDFAFPTDHRAKIKESKKRDRYLDLKNLRGKTVIVISILVGALRTVPKGLERW